MLWGRMEHGTEKETNIKKLKKKKLRLCAKRTVYPSAASCRRTSSLLNHGACAAPAPAAAEAAPAPAAGCLN